jgi:hypothetical protein
MKALFVSIIALTLGLSAYSQTGTATTAKAVDYSKPEVANRAPRYRATAAKVQQPVNSMAPEALPARPARKAQPRVAASTEANTPATPQNRK